MDYSTISKILIIFIIFSLSPNIHARDNVPTTPYEITKYEIHVTIPDTYEKIEIYALLDIKNIDSDPYDELAIMLCRNFKGIKPVDIQIFDARRNPLTFTLYGDSLRINVSNHFKNSTTEKIAIHYDLIKDEEFYDTYTPFACEISDTSCHMNAAITRTDNWYPKIEGTMHKRLPEFELFIDVPSQFEVMASGRLMYIIIEGDRKIYQWKNYDEVSDRSLCFFAQQRKQIVKHYPDGFNVILYIPEHAREDNITYIADVIYKSYTFFEKIFGNVPGNEYKIMAFAHGYSGLFNAMTVPSFLFTDEIHNDEILYPIRAVIHEVSHTWWGNLISSDAEEDYWLYEGFAKYSETIGIKEVLGADIELLSFSRLKLASMPYLDNVLAIHDAGKEDNRHLQAVAAYYIGATYLKMLEFIMGKKNFDEAMRDYVDTYRGQCVSTFNFIDIMKKHSDGDIHNLLSDYLMFPGYARYSLKKIGTVNKGRHYVHTYEIKNTGDRDIYTILKVQSDMESYTKRLFMAQSESFMVDVKSQQQYGSGFVILDPDGIFPLCEDGLKGAGGMVYEDNKGDVIFINVIDSAPLSNAGIQNNMVLLNVDGKALPSKNLYELNNLFLQHEGARIKLLVRSEKDEPFEVVTSF